MSAEAKSEQLIDLGVNQKRLGNYSEALRYYNEAIKIDPNNGMAYYSKAKLLYILGLYDQAVESYLKYFYIGYTYIVKDIEMMKRNGRPQFEIIARKESLKMFIKSLCLHLGHALYDQENNTAYGKIYLSKIDPYNKTKHLAGVTNADIEKMKDYENTITHNALEFIKIKFG